MRIGLVVSLTSAALCGGFAVHALLGDYPGFGVIFILITAFNIGSAVGTMEKLYGKG